MFRDSGAGCMREARDKQRCVGDEAFAYFFAMRLQEVVFAAVRGRCRRRPLGFAEVGVGDVLVPWVAIFSPQQQSAQTEERQARLAAENSPQQAGGFVACDFAQGVARRGIEEVDEL